MSRLTLPSYPPGGSAGQVLTQNASGVPTWQVGGGLPAGATQGQILTMGASAAQWSPAPLTAPPFLSGQWYGGATHGWFAGGVAAATQTGTHVILMDVPQPTAFKTLMIGVTTAGAAGSVARLGVGTYDFSANTVSVLLDAGTVTTAATGTPKATFAQTFSGIIALVVSFSGAGCGMNCYTTSSASYVWGQSFTSQMKQDIYVATDYTAAAFPATLTGFSYGSGYFPPVLLMQAA